MEKANLKEVTLKEAGLKKAGLTHRTYAFSRAGHRALLPLSSRKGNGKPHIVTFLFWGFLLHAHPTDTISMQKQGTLQHTCF